MDPLGVILLIVVAFVVLFVLITLFRSVRVVPQQRMDVVERLGSDQFLYGQVGSDQVTARVDPRMAVQPGDKVRLGLDVRTLHFFDAESEQALI